MRQIGRWIDRQKENNPKMSQFLKFKYLITLKLNFNGGRAGLKIAYSNQKTYALIYSCLQREPKIPIYLTDV